MQHWSSGQWYLFIRDYEADVIYKENIKPYQPPSKDERDIKTVTIALEHLSHNRCSRARKLLKSYGLSNIVHYSILEQLQAKHPQQKQAIPDLTTD
eukprot:14228023-Ditylum_brightwellii.AAC.1